MNYISTRDTNSEKYRVSSAQAIKMGLAPDGGLFMPEEIPTLSSNDIEKLRALPYNERAAQIMSMFLTDYSYDELLADCSAAYSEERFPGGAAPLRFIGNGTYSLELWHGPTCAFKDMALQLMPRLLSRALVKTGEKRTAQILVATSGDTGKAALEGYRDINQIRILVFYPEDGVSAIQKLQMTTQEGSNVRVCAIKGNFDDAQNGVKRIFADAEIADKLNDSNTFLSSANSINWGRLAPQIVYYISAYCDLVNRGDIFIGEKINVCVPTGNFGNIFAAYIARKMGLPIKKLICASNMNNVLTDFIETGIYDRNRVFHKTMSPSMDILISSNLERLIFLIAGAEKTAAYMKQLSEKGKYQVDSDILAEIKDVFCGYYCSEENTADIIRRYFNDGYLSDTHTAVGLFSADKYKKETGDQAKLVVASTASPYKFAADVCRSIDGGAHNDDIAAQKELFQISKMPVPAPLSRVLSLPIRFTQSVNPNDMADVVLDCAK